MGSANPSDELGSSEVDFGDAPDSADNPADYATLRESNGAWHAIDYRYYLGAGVDSDDRPYATPNAAGDDVLDGNDDEDGVIFQSALGRGKRAEIKVIASNTGVLDAWIDFNGDRDWSDPGEQIFTSTQLVKGVNKLSFNVPENASPGVTFARFRFSSWGGLPSWGGAPDGEVEDYRIVIR